MLDICYYTVVITCEKSSGASFLDKSLKKELYGLGYGCTKPAKIYPSYKNKLILTDV